MPRIGPPANPRPAERRSRRAALLATWALLGFAVEAPADSLDIVAAARQQVGITVIYDGRYQALEFPGGDIPIERGVCTDVVVRALRSARSLDLQKLVHEDMRANFQAYPNQPRWGLTGPDANIDHRRVPNLMVYFKRAGLARPVTQQAPDYLPGDLVAWNLGGGILHIGIVSDRRANNHVPLVIHNIGAGTREEDILFKYAIIGHYRLSDVAGR